MVESVSSWTFLWFSAFCFVGGYVIGKFGERR